MPPRPSSVLLTKLHRPPLTDDRIERPRLIAMLDRGLAGPLSLVTGPAGFGKTTVVSSWVEWLARSQRPPLPSAWLSLDEDDSDLVVFLRYLIAAIRTIFPGSCAESAGMLEAAHQPPIGVLHTAINNEIALLPHRFVLVLDDYHRIQGESVHDFVNALLRHWPPAMHLVLVARISPPLPLASLRAGGRLGEIRGRDLRFTPEEMATYAARSLPTLVSESVVAALEQYTEGWAAGLHLACLSLQSGGNLEHLLPGSPAPDVDVANYLVDEVLSLQPPPIQAFLLRTSILDRFCAALYEAISGFSAGDEDPQWSPAACVEWSRRANLFVVSLDDGGQWYRYHHLFRGLLQQRLLAEVGADGVNELHRRAADWFRQQGLLDEGIRHALAANDLDFAGKIMAEGLADVLNREDRPTVDRWLRLLPEEFIERRPDLLMIRVWALQFAWQVSAEWRVIGQVEALIAEPGSSALSARELKFVRGQLMVLHAQAAFFRCDPQRALALCQEALTIFPLSWNFMRGAAMFYLGLAMQASGDGQAAVRLLLDEYASLSGDTGSYGPLLLSSSCFVLYREGQLGQVRRVAQMLLERTPATLPIPRSWGNYFLGLVQYEQGEPDAAREHFDWVVQRRYFTQVLIALNSFFGLILAEQTLGETAAADEALQLLNRFDLEMSSAEAERTRSLAARVMLMRGDLSGASQWADAFTSPPTAQPLHWPEEPHLTKAHILLARAAPGDVEAAVGILDALQETGRSMRDFHFQVEVLAMLALAHEMRGSPVDALATLQHAVDLARQGGLTRPFVDLGPPMRSLLVGLANRGYAVDAVRRILAAFSQPGVEPAPGAETGARAANAAAGEPLTERELEVLALLRERLSNKEVAQRLHVSVMTAKRHSSNIYRKLGVDNRRDAVVKAESLGILPPV